MIRLQSALEEIRSYEPPIGESPRETIDKLQDMAATALRPGPTGTGAPVGTTPTRKRTVEELRAAVEARRKAHSAISSDIPGET